MRLQHIKSILFGYAFYWIMVAVISFAINPRLIMSLLFVVMTYFTLGCFCMDKTRIRRFKEMTTVDLYAGLIFLAPGFISLPKIAIQKLSTSFKAKQN